MLKNILLVLGAAVLVSGCAGVKAKTYVMTTERVDIEGLKEGNAGYISGKGAYQEPEKKTRKVYVLELTKPVTEGDVKKIQQEVEEAPQQQVARAPVAVVEQPKPIQAPTPRKIVIPDLDDVVPAQAVVSRAEEAIGPTVAQEYTVMKDDTLQKIAKKFYNSYGKWIKIYEANKDKIKNPNFVRPGTVITIPAVDGKN